MPQLFLSDERIACHQLEISQFFQQTLSSGNYSTIRIQFSLMKTQCFGKYFHKNNRIIPGVRSRVKSNHQSREIKTKPHLIDVMWRQGNVWLEQYFLKPTTVKRSFNICALNLTLGIYWSCESTILCRWSFATNIFSLSLPKRAHSLPGVSPTWARLDSKMFTFSSFPFLALCTKRSRSFLHSFVDLTLKWTVVKPKKLRQRVTKSYQVLVQYIFHDKVYHSTQKKFIKINIKAKKIFPKEKWKVFNWKSSSGKAES